MFVWHSKKSRVCQSVSPFIRWCPQKNFCQNQEQARKHVKGSCCVRASSDRFLAVFCLKRLIHFWEQRPCPRVSWAQYARRRRLTLQACILEKVTFIWDATQGGRCVASQGSHKYHSACIRARTKFVGVVVTRLRCHISPPSCGIPGRLELFQRKFVARCPVTLSRVAGAGGMGRKQRRSLSPCGNPFNTSIFRGNCGDASVSLNTTNVLLRTISKLRQTSPVWGNSCLILYLAMDTSLHLRIQ